jgi:uncharacterized protein YidB (DUF937 family)/outer membrane protein OmpA-like peptidoglycan-associated protein
MALFDSIIDEVQKKFGLGDKAGGLLTVLLSMISDKENGGFSGFLARFKEAGLGDLAASWVNTGANMPLSNEQTESVFGEGTLKEVSDEVGLDYKTTTSATAFMVPHLVDKLTPTGEVPDEKGLLSMVGGYLTGISGAIAGVAGATAGENVDRIGTAAVGAVNTGKDTIGDGINAVSGKVGGALDGISENGGGNSLLKILLPLIIIGLLLALGYMFCGKSDAPTVTNTNANKANANTANVNSTANAVESSFTLKAENGKYIVSGVVKDEATKKQIMDALTAQYGAGNVDFAGLKVDANAKPFAAGWWDNFQKLLPNLKDWKTGSLAFAGNAITEAVGLPAAALDQIKSLFSGWTLPASLSGATADANRKLTEVSLPDGTKLQAYPGGIEDQLIKFIESDEYKNGTAESLKEKWFNFDDLNFKFGTTELVPESKRQLDNIVAILKAFPNAKIKIGGYTDKKGDDAANKKLSGERAKAVKAALEKAGVGAQVPEAEGYGEEFATIPETGSDEERKADRKTAVRLLK